jgi:hypothetical protein
MSFLSLSVLIVLKLFVVYFSEKDKALILSANVGNISAVRDELLIFSLDPANIGPAATIPLPSSVHSSGEGFLDQDSQLLYLLGQGHPHCNVTIFNVSSQEIVNQTTFYRYGTFDFDFWSIFKRFFLQPICFQRNLLRPPNRVVYISFEPVAVSACEIGYVR